MVSFIPDKKGLRTDWGFSCLVEGLDKTILFDAGRYDDIFLSNLSKLNVDLERIDALFLSHDHPDHTGGAMKVLDARPDTNVWLVESFPRGFKKAIGKEWRNMIKGVKKWSESFRFGLKHEMILRETSTSQVYFPKSPVGRNRHRRPGTRPCF